MLGKAADARLPRRVRLRQRSDFHRVFARPKKSVDPYFTVLARRNRDRPARLGLAISKKSARRAVDRSHLKRIVRESFRQCRHDLYGIDLVVLCRHRAATSPNGLLFASLSVHWKRLRNRLCVTC